MTPSEKLEWKKLASEAITEYLKTEINYPNCENDVIMSRLPNLWNLLGEKRLIQEGMTYGLFVHFANQKYMEAEMQRIIGLRVTRDL